MIFELKYPFYYFSRSIHLQNYTNIGLYQKFGKLGRIDNSCNVQQNIGDTGKTPQEQVLAIEVVEYAIVETP